MCDAWRYKSLFDDQTFGTNIAMMFQMVRMLLCVLYLSMSCPSELSTSIVTRCWHRSTIIFSENMCPLAAGFCHPASQFGASQKRSCHTGVRFALSRRRKQDLRNVASPPCCLFCEIRPTPSVSACFQSRSPTLGLRGSRKSVVRNCALCVPSLGDRDRMFTFISGE